MHNSTRPFVMTQFVIILYEAEIIYDHCRCVPRRGAAQHVAASLRESVNYTARIAGRKLLNFRCCR